MLRSEVQSKTGLTRKAIEYYEEKGIIKPQKLDNGYKDYSENDCELLAHVSTLRKIGMSVSEIKEVLHCGSAALVSMLRKKQYQLDIEERKSAILELIVKGEDQKKIHEKLQQLEKEETIYEKLQSAFPGFFGQLFFLAYQPFLDEPIRKNGEEAYAQYIRFLDALPPFKVTKEEQEYIDKSSSFFDRAGIKELHKNKINAIANIELWLEENKDSISQYEAYKKSEEYQNSPLKQVHDKLQNYMIENNYYEVAIPLIRAFSKSYDAYYQQLIKANDTYVKMSS